MTALSTRLAPPAVAPVPGPHLGLRWRAILPSDAPTVAAVIRAAESDDDAIIRTEARDIAEAMSFGFSPDVKDTIVGIDDEGQIRAVASVLALGGVTEVAAAVIRAAIDREWRGRGIGRALLHWQDARARQMLIDMHGADSELPVVIMNWVDAHMTDRRRLYIAAGFYARRTFQVMRRELPAGLEAPAAPAGYRIVPLAETDVNAVRAAHLDAFRGHFMPAFSGQWWREAMSAQHPDWSFVALTDEGEVAAYAISALYPERWIAQGTTECYVELLGVSEAHRGQGLATALLETVAAAASQDGIAAMGLDVDMSSASAAHSIYEHLGFTDHRSLIFYSIEE